MPLAVARVLRDVELHDGNLSMDTPDTRTPPLNSELCFRLFTEALAWC